MDGRGPTEVLEGAEDVAAGGSRCGDGGDGDAMSAPAANARGGGAAAVQVVVLMGTGPGSGPGTLAASVERMSGGAATSAEVVLILNCRIRRSRYVVEIVSG